jgi:gluconokinase
LGDGVGSSIGSGCTSRDRIALAMGTSGAMRVTLEGTPQKLPPGLWSYRVDRRRSLLGGAVSNGTNVFDWLGQTLSLPEPEAVEAALASLPPASHGLRVLPLLAGERSPGWADDATAAFAGLRWSTRPIQILQAGLEAVAYRFALIHRSLASQVPKKHTIVASGKGFTASPTWVQIMADVLGQPVVVSEQKSATARGIALLAFDVLGIEPLKSASLSGGKVVRPNPKRRALHEAALARHQELYAALIGA